MSVRDVRLLRARDPREPTVTRTGRTVRPPRRRTGPDPDRAPSGQDRQDEIGGKGPSTPDPVPYCPVPAGRLLRQREHGGDLARPAGRRRPPWTPPRPARGPRGPRRPGRTRSPRPAYRPPRRPCRRCPETETSAVRLRSRTAGSVPETRPELTTTARSPAATAALSTRSIRRLANPASTSLVVAAGGSPFLSPSSAYDSRAPESTPASSVSGSWKPAGWLPPVT